MFDITGAEDRKLTCKDPSQSLADIENGTEFNITGVLAQFDENDGDTRSLSLTLLIQIH